MSSRRLGIERIIGTSSIAMPAVKSFILPCAGLAGCSQPAICICPRREGVNCSFQSPEGNRCRCGRALEQACAVTSLKPDVSLNQPFDFLAELYVLAIV